MWLGPASRCGLLDALQDGQNDQGMKQRPLQTHVTRVEPFFFLILILMNKVVPQPGPWRGCCRGPHGQRRALPAPGRAEVLLVWVPGCGVEAEDLHLRSQGQETQVA